jgi:membrane-associated HD superfamily phosphohydrolase
VRDVIKKAREALVRLENNKPIVIDVVKKINPATVAREAEISRSNLRTDRGYSDVDELIKDIEQAEHLRQKKAKKAKRKKISREKILEKKDDEIEHLRGEILMLKNKLLKYERNKQQGIVLQSISVDK